MRIETPSSKLLTLWSRCLPGSGSVVEVLLCGKITKVCFLLDKNWPSVQAPTSFLFA